jgi:hypothetical protein
MIADEPVEYHAHIFTTLRSRPTANETNAGARLAAESDPVFEEETGILQNTAL